MSLYADTINFDYNIVEGSLNMVEGSSASVAAQLFELVTNQGEWFLGPSFGYPWLVKNSKGENTGLLGTVFNSGYTTSVLSEKLLSNEGVRSIESISLVYDAGKITGNIQEIMYENVADKYAETIPVTFTFSFGGDL